MNNKRYIEICDYCNQETDLHDISIDDDTPNPQGKLICDSCRNRVWNLYSFPDENNPTKTRSELNYEDKKPCVL